MRVKIGRVTIEVYRDAYSYKYAEKMILKVTHESGSKIPPIKWLRTYANERGRMVDLRIAKEFVEAIWAKHDITWETLKEEAKRT